MGEKMIERLTFFSDAVFAIAITLLVIELHPPHLHFGPGARHEALIELLKLTPQFIGFFVSFFVIGAFWAAHHRIFGMIGHYDGAIVWPNLFLLASIAFLPFSTAFMSVNSGQLVPHIFYLVTLLVSGLLQVALYRRILSPRYLAADVDPIEVAMMRARIWGLPSATMLGFVIACVEPFAANLALCATPLFIRFYMKMAASRYAAA